MTVKILRGDNRNTLKTLEDKSIHTVVTSPPYWGLRDYGTATWEGGDTNCDHVANPQATKKMGNEEFNKNRPSREETKTKGYYENICPKCGARRIDNQLGLEETPEEYVNNLVDVFREIKRVLRDDGTVWLNLGDSYSSGGRRTTTNQSLRGDKDYGVTRPAPSKGIKPKDLIGIPWRVAFALQQDGWYLRQDIIWHKPNPMPESVRDRCTKAHEYIFLLSKNVKYYYDHEAIKEPSAEGTLLRLSQKNLQNQKGLERAHAGVKSNGNMKAVGGLKKNKRSVWTVTTKPFKEAHFATFPMDLIEPCIKAGSSEHGCCSKCGNPYIRDVKVVSVPERTTRNNMVGVIPGRNKTTRMNSKEMKPLVREQKGWVATCNCDADVIKCVVLDPFGGAGTTGIVASNHNRNAILCELNDEYSDIAEKRIESNLPLFSGKN